MDANMSAQMGLQGDRLRIAVEWFDHNNVSHVTIVQVRILDCDKPRTLVVECGSKYDVSPTECRDEMPVQEAYSISW
jgi:hypothetical protein